MKPQTEYVFVLETEMKPLGSKLVIKGSHVS